MWENDRDLGKIVFFQQCGVNKLQPKDADWVNQLRLAGGKGRYGLFHS